MTKFIKHLSSALLCYLALLCALLPYANADEAPVTLYLPYITPDLSEQLEQALKNAGVGTMKVDNGDFWHPYQQGLRKGRRGVYFAQPHFAAWSIQRHGFQAIYKLHGRLKYVLASRRTDNHLFEINDLQGRVICREAGLNLGTVWLNNLLGDYRLTALSEEVASVEQAMKVNNKKCDAFVVDDYAYDRINKGQLGPYIRLKQSPVYKHNALVAHPEIPQATTSALKKALKSKRIKSLLKPYFSKLSKWQNLLPVQAEDYTAADYKLLDAYWGKHTGT